MAGKWSAVPAFTTSTGLPAPEALLTYEHLLTRSRHYQRTLSSLSPLPQQNSGQALKSGCLRLNQRSQLVSSSLDAGHCANRVNYTVKPK